MQFPAYPKRLGFFESFHSNRSREPRHSEPSGLTWYSPPLGIRPPVSYTCGSSRGKAGGMLMRNWKVSVIVGYLPEVAENLKAPTRFSAPPPVGRNAIPGCRLMNALIWLPISDMPRFSRTTDDLHSRHFRRHLRRSQQASGNRIGYGHTKLL